MLQKISERLKKIAGLVPENAKVADIGADHGYLSVFLAESGKAQRVYACDIKEKPLENARKSVSESNAGFLIELRLCDGLKGVSKDEIDTAVIAGMGAEAIVRIISECEWIKSEKYTLILQPMTSPEILRKYLAENGFEILSECAVEENQKLYSIIKTVFTGKRAECNNAFYYIGKLDPANETDLKYIKKQYKRFKKCADSLQSSKDKQDLYYFYKKTADEIGGFSGDK